MFKDYSRKTSLVVLLLVSHSTCFAASQESQPISICQKSLENGNYREASAVCTQQLLKSQTDNKQLESLQIQLSLVDIYHALGEKSKEQSTLDEIANHPQFSRYPEISYRWHRQKGRLAYFENEFELAKKHLYQGLAIAQTANQPTWISKSFNDVGLIESKFNDYKKSLIHYQSSLALKLEQGDAYAVGTTLNNIGLNYTKLENYSRAVEYYEKALSSFLLYTQNDHFDRRVFDNITHLYEDLAVAYSQLDDKAKEAFYEQKTLQSVANKTSPRQQARALINIAKLEIQADNLKSAQAFLDRATELQETEQFDLRLELAVEKSKVLLASNDLENAIYHANSGLIIAKEKNSLQIIAELYQILSSAYNKQDIHTAYHYLKLFAQTREAYLKQKFDSELSSIQLKIENQQIEHQLMSEKITNAENQTKIQRLTNWTLMVVILLIISFAAIIFIGYRKRKERQVLLESIQSHQQQLMLLDDKFQHLNQSREPTISVEDSKQNLRETLVNTMLNVVSIWEKHTGKNKVELAEKSKLWTVSIDNGNLRTRSLDKYLTLDKIPANPKWRNVAGTCHFVLSDESLDSGARSQLKMDLDNLMRAVKSFSLSTQHHS